MEFKRKKFSFKLDGESYEFGFPNVKQFSEYQKKLEKGKGKELDLIVDFLEGLGLKREVTESMEADHLVQIVDVLSGQKKI
jgi:NAD(P)H-hydrate repair Nnr-like enzyme with NAD(P)H-hydrate epimerase domain